jgi:hypothetical protein
MRRAFTKERPLRDRVVFEIDPGSRIVDAARTSGTRIPAALK